MPLPYSVVLRRSQRPFRSLSALCFVGKSQCESSRSIRRFASASEGARRRRLGRTLYRGLLRWCQETDETIPLSSFVPPVHLAAPESISQTGLKALADDGRHDDDIDPQLEFIRGLLPKKSIIESHQLTIPIRSSSDLRGLFRAVFRLNCGSTEENGETKKRTSLALETLKSVNELTEALEDIKKQREAHVDRTGVLYSVGQVVQHERDRWRGVILDWRRTRENQNESLEMDVPTSLTRKDYTSNMPVADSPKEEEIEYSILIDMGDAHLLGGTRKTNDQSGIPVAVQSDLKPVEDKRVRSNWIPHSFDRFDAHHNRFIPNEAKRFIYPSDGFEVAAGEVDGGDSPKDSEPVAEAGARVVDGVKEFATKLEAYIANEIGRDGSGEGLVASYQRRLSSLSIGNVVSTHDRLSPAALSATKIAIKHLQKLLRLSMEVSELMWHRHISEMAKRAGEIRYSLGDVVVHKKYGFRGVVVAWDPKPAVDVSRWDGLTEIENPMELPFYHIIPDQNDCVRVFGGERPFRYVCEANLELCPPHRTLLDVDLEPEWQASPSESRYVPPEELKFKYAEDLGDDDKTASILSFIKKEIEQLHLALRDSTALNVKSAFSLEDLFLLLREADCMDEAVVVEETIKEIWKAHREPEIRRRLDDGLADLLNGKKEKALSIFSQLVVDDPCYAEAWNKKSTCHFMLGDMQSSLEAAERTLELQPNHFQALNGLGLVHYETKRYRLSAESFRRSIRIDPWSPVSSRLLVCHDVLKSMGIIEEEEGAEEGSAPYET